MPGNDHGRDITIVDVFEAVGAHAVGKIDDSRLAELERNAVPTAGACPGQYTAITMASVSEAIGLYPGFTRCPSVCAQYWGWPRKPAAC